MSRQMTFELPTFASIVATRAALGFGIGLLASERIPADRRRVIGLALVSGGLLSTVPAVRWVRQALKDGRRARSRREVDTAAVGQDSRLIGMQRFPRRGDDEFAG